MSAYNCFRQRRDSLSPDAVAAWDDILDTLSTAELGLGAAGTRGESQV